VAFFGAFGYELDLTALEADELEQIADQVRFYREHRSLFQFGRFVRLVSPFDGDGNETAWMVVSDDRSRAILGWYRGLNRPVPGPRRVRPRGLDPMTRYRITLWPEPDDDAVLDGVDVRGGDELMEAGLIPGPFLRETAGLGDFASRLFVLEAIPDGP
jgi:alpha-galactosidase